MATRNNTTKKSNGKTSTTKKRTTAKKNVVQEEMNNPIPPETDYDNVDDIDPSEFDYEHQNEVEYASLFDVITWNILDYLMRIIRWFVCVFLVIPVFVALAVLFSAIVFPLAMLFDVTRETITREPYSARYKNSMLCKITDMLATSYAAVEYGE